MHEHEKDTLKEVLFRRAELALNAYHTAIRVKVISEEGDRLHERFCAIYDIIKEAGLVDQFDLWLEG